MHCLRPTTARRSDAEVARSQFHPRVATRGKKHGKKDKRERTELILPIKPGSRPEETSVLNFLFRRRRRSLSFPAERLIDTRRTARVFPRRGKNGGGRLIKLNKIEQVLRAWKTRGERRSAPASCQRHRADKMLPREFTGKRAESFALNRRVSRRRDSPAGASRPAPRIIS